MNTIRRHGIFIVVSVLGLAAFVFPFWIPMHQAVNSAHRFDAPVWSALIAGGCLLAVTLDIQNESLNGTSVALVGLLSAVVGILRAIDLPAGGSGMFFLLVIVGAMFGARLGFVIGVMSMLVSAVFTGGLGPWLPFQALATGWMAVGAALVFSMLRNRSQNTKVIGLVVYAWCAGFLFGALTDLWFWPITVSSGPLSWSASQSVVTNLQHFWSFHVSIHKSRRQE